MELLKALDKIQRIRVDTDHGELRESRRGRFVEFEEVKTVIGQYIVDISKPCEWRYDEDDGSWDGACGAKWRLEDAGPTDHGMKFCPCCGKPLVEIPTSKTP